MDTQVLVYVDTEEVPRLAGRLWARSRRGRESASFEYDPSWLREPYGFGLEPALPPGRGSFHTLRESPLFGAFGDTAPDRWGRVLMRRAERRRADSTGETPRFLQEVDYLLRVDDEARQGALRLAVEEGGPFLAAPEPNRIPPLVELPRLLSASDRVLAEEETDEDLRLLLAPGSSLGGARPKASVRDRNGELALAKFPRRDDEFPAVQWEAVALSLAKKAGLSVPLWRLESVADRAVLLLKRFDREGAARVPFLSAMTMLEARDHETRSYLEIVDALRQYGAAPKNDMRQLWRRIVFSVLISNTDDHLRNHGFLRRDADGWRLSPAYDLNPVPTDLKPRVLATAIDLDDNTASLELALRVAPYFELTSEQAKDIAKTVAKGVALWRREAARYGLTSTEIDRLSSAFEHVDSRNAGSL